MLHVWHAAVRLCAAVGHMVEHAVPMCTSLSFDAIMRAAMTHIGVAALSHIGVAAMTHIGVAAMSHVR